MSCPIGYGYANLPGDMCCNNTSGSTYSTLARTYIYGLSTAGAAVVYNNQRIPFNNLTVNTNLGGSYNTATGLFTASRVGYFCILFNLHHSGGPSAGNIQLRKNTGNTLTFTPLSFGHGTYYCSIVAPLNAGETLDVYLNGNETFDMSISTLCIYEL